MLKSKLSLSRHFEYANKQITYHFWLCGKYNSSSIYILDSNKSGPHPIVWYRCFTYVVSFCHSEEFEDAIGVIRCRDLKKDRQHNGQKEKGQKDKQRSAKHTHKTKDRVT